MATSSESATSPVRPRSRTRTVVVSVLAVLALVWAGRFLYRYWIYEETDDAYVTGHVHQISPQIDGQVIDVLIHENEPVKQGQLLVRLDPLAGEIALAKARAAVAQAKAGEAQAGAASKQADSALLEAHARAGQAAAETAEARAQAALALITLNRDRAMSTGADRAVTPADFDKARASYDAAKAAVQAADAEAKAMQAAVAAAQDARTAAAAEVQAAQANMQAAEAGVRDAERLVSYTTIHAPADGTIGNKNVETGNRVQMGQQLFALVEPEVWIEANFKETQLALMRVGQPAEVTIDAIPGHTFHCRVASIAPASGAEFALLPADNATGNFTKVVQRVPVRIAFDPREIQPYTARLRPGLSAEVSVLVR